MDPIASLASKGRARPPAQRGTTGDWTMLGLMRLLPRYVVVLVAVGIAILLAPAARE